MPETHWKTSKMKSMSGGLKPGDKCISRYLDGTEHEDIVHSIRYRSAQPEIRKNPTGWRRILRHLVPQRWRKPLPIARPYQPAEVEVVGVSQVARRAELLAADMKAALSQILSP